MPAARLLRIPIFRVFNTRTTVPLLPFSARQTARSRSPLGSGAAGRSNASKKYSLTSRRAYSTSPSPPSSPTSESAPKSLSSRLKQLIKTHGWYALGVYLSLTVIDFSLTFAAIYFLGAEQVGRLTGRLKDTMTETIGWPAPSQSNPAHDIDEGTVSAPNNLDGIYAMAFLAYGIHKTLWLPFRIGLTAALTPRLVTFLQRRGWVGEGGICRAAQHVRDKVRKPSDGVGAQS